MTFDEMTAALDHMDLRLPYGLLPGSHMGGYHNPAESKATWDAYRWGGPGDDGGPQYLSNVDEFKKPDNDAAPKPSWSELEMARPLGLLASRKDGALKEIKIQEQNRIRFSYLERSGTSEEEMWYRLRVLESDGDISKKHDERNRLHSRAVALQEWVADHARTAEELEAFDASEDVHWAEPSPGGATSNPQILGDADVTTTNALVYSPTGVLIPAGIVEGGGTAYLRALEFRGEFVTIKLSATDSGDGDDVGPEFTEAWKQNGTFTVTSGTESVTVPGPQASSNLLSDPSEPYHYTLGSRVAQEAFITAVHAATDRSSSVAFST